MARATSTRAATAEHDASSSQAILAADRRADCAERESLNLLVRGDALDLAAPRPGRERGARVPRSAVRGRRRASARARRREARARSGPVAYDDRWPSLEAYLAWLEPRVARRAWRCSRRRGTMWLHLDQRAVHEAKVVCDRVFGARRVRRRGHLGARQRQRRARRGPGMTHQTLLLYARGDGLRLERARTRRSARRSPRRASSMHFTNAATPTGARYRERIVGGKTYRYYADEGRALGSVWTDCPAMVANTPLRAETTGYPTQKPLKLLDRIVRASSDAGRAGRRSVLRLGDDARRGAALGRRFVGLRRRRARDRDRRARASTRRASAYRFVAHSEAK